MLQSTRIDCFFAVFLQKFIIGPKFATSKRTLKFCFPIRVQHCGHSPIPVRGPDWWGGASTPRQASGLRSQAPHKAGRVGTTYTRWGGRPRGGIQAATRRCNSSPTSSEARAMVWGGVDSSRTRPRRGRTIREIRARGVGINGPLRGPKSTIPHTPHLRSLPRSMWGYHCIAASRLGWQNAHAPRARRCRNTHPPRRA